MNDSVTKTKTADGEAAAEEDTEQQVYKSVLKRAFIMNLAEMPFILLGMIGAGMAGASFPLSAVLFSEVSDIYVHLGAGSMAFFVLLIFVFFSFCSYSGSLTHVPHFLSLCRPLKKFSPTTQLAQCGSGLFST